MKKVNKWDRIGSKRNLSANQGVTILLVNAT